MPEQMRPASKELAPDPSDNYERSHPEHEAGMGRLDNNAKATPTKRPDQMPDAVKNAQDGSKQINAHNDINQQRRATVEPEKDPDEPLGWQQPPKKVEYPRDQPESLEGGRKGTPNPMEGMGGVRKPD
jgi:hypothetical protein